MAGVSTFTQKVADKICKRLIEGESLRSICKDESLPCTSTVCKWLSQNDTFAEQYARAREFQADTLADEILDIADDATNDWMERLTDEDKGIGWQVNGDHVQRSRLRIDSRKWMAGKLKPKKYGDKSSIEHTGADGSPLFEALQDCRNRSAGLPKDDK